jgi:hypothetical protein
VSMLETELGSSGENLCSELVLMVGSAYSISN